MAKQLTLTLSDLPAPKAKDRKRTPEQAWLAWAAEAWAAFHQAKMTVRWARDLVLVRPLLQLHGEEELKRRWKAYVATMDEYFARRGWDVPSFSAAIDRYRFQPSQSQVHQGNKKSIYESKCQENEADHHL